MLFSYKAVDKSGVQRDGTVDAINMESAIETVEARGYTIVTIDPLNDKASIFDVEVTWFQRVSNKEVVILSRQIATLFEAQVSALRIFRLLGSETHNPKLQKILTQVSDDLQGGSSISRALGQHPDVFSSFYVSMVKSGEESGTLEKTFMFLADYLDRMYEVVSKARNALIYPAFVIAIFMGVMILMLTMVIPSITKIIVESGQDIPIYTKIVMGVSSLFTEYIGIMGLVVALIGIVVWQFQRTEAGKRTIDEFKLTIPFIGNLYEKLFLTRVCDNLSTMLMSGISMVQALEVTAEVVDNRVYKEIIEDVLVSVKGGKSFADSISEYPEIPGILAQMSKVGEETGKLGDILTTLSNFYRREVNNAVDTLIGLIEPAMIVMLGLGVGVLLASVLMPIYNITGSI
ncbi:MAG TPA: type II secretion system F family protein [Candidatus Paceibacterota bacterium]|nr:type II secretion system F family protein [Candidatus Paceibacterota bacterium]